MQTKENQSEPNMTDFAFYKTLLQRDESKSAVKGTTSQQSHAQ